MIRDVLLHRTPTIKSNDLGSAFHSLIVMYSLSTQFLDSVELISLPA